MPTEMHRPSVISRHTHPATDIAHHYRPVVRGTAMTSHLSMQLAALLINEQMRGIEHERSGHPHKHPTRSSRAIPRPFDVLAKSSR